MADEIDAMALYRAWQQLDNGSCAQIRRVSEPDELRDIPAFYRLVQPFGWENPRHQQALLRMVFCLSAGKNVIRHQDKKSEQTTGISLGRALANSGRINERRIFQLIRADRTADMVQLRRLLTHAEPVLDWPLMARMLTWWGKRERQQLLEDFVLTTNKNAQGNLSMSNFINIHVLISHSPSCLNRDDMNMQKDAIFGGKRRVRISSQSLKRAMRKSGYYAQNIGESSLRTIHLAQLRDVLRQKLGERFDQKIIDKTLALLSGKSVDEAEKISADAVTPWVVGEIAWFCEQVAKAEADNLDDKKLLKVLKEDIAAIRVNLQQGVDIALSGRMATSGMMTELGKVDGAMSIAHAITTHQVDSDIDWFTAVDDLQEQGSAHLGTQEFSSGVFYRYANINLAQLQENLGGASREQALEIATHVVHMLATEVPGAKQRTYAAFNPADMVMVNFSDMPLSMANAFEKAVKAKDGFLQPSIQAFNQYWDRVANGYGLNGAAAQFSLSDVDPITAQVKQMPTLEQLKSWVRNNGEA